MELFFLAVTLLLIALSVIVNRDLFSPTKFYLLFLFVFFAELFIYKQQLIVNLFYFIYLTIGAVFVFVEKQIIGNRFKEFNTQNLYLNEKLMLLTLFGLSSVPVMGQLYLITLFGGLEGYLISLKLRVDEWRGLGPILAVIKLFPIINIVFFSIGLNFEIQKKRVWYSFFFMHVIVMISLGALSGSRGGVLVGLLYIIIAFNYGVKHISVKKALIFLVFFLLTASVLEKVRMSFSYSSDGFSSGQENADFSKIALFSYGISPINIILNEDFESLQYGSTFASGFTNVIPRFIWPSKPETGGVVLTKFKDKDAYAGTTNESPGIMVEGILNFGYILGPIVGLCLFNFLFMISIFIYKKHLTLMNQNYIGMKKVKITFCYLITVSMPASFLFAEFANVIAALIMKLISFFLLYFVIIISMRVNNRVFR